MAIVEPTNADEQFVYIFRDKAGRPVYIGRGRKGERSLAHFGDQAHNEELTELLRQEAVTVEAAGPLGSQEIAEIVEGALISAFRLTPAIGDRLRNKNLGSSAGRFRPLGVPIEFVDRAAEPPLTVDDLISAAGSRSVITVLITSEELADGRKGFDMAIPLPDDAIVERMVKWWPIRQERVGHWEAGKERAPGLLIAMSGTLRHRVVVASLEIDQGGRWEVSQKTVGRYRIPARLSVGLDFASLRGRLIDEDAGRSQESGIRIIPAG